MQNNHTAFWTWAAAIGALAAIGISLSVRNAGTVSGDAPETVSRSEGGKDETPASDPGATEVGSTQGSGPTAMDRVAQRLAERLEERAASGPSKREAERLARWKERFPYEPTYHESVRYDPESFEELDDEDPEAHARLEDLVSDHGFLANFYQNPWRHTAEFEAFYDLMAEAGRAERVITVAELFHDLVDIGRAAIHDPNSPQLKPAFVVNPETGLTEKGWTPVGNAGGESPTWGDRLNEMETSFVARLTSPDSWPDGESPYTEVEAREFLDTIRGEIPAEDLALVKERFPHGFASDDSESAKLKAGDPLLVN